MRVFALFLLLCATPAAAEDQIDRYRDRGEGVPLSIFGTYIKAKEWLVYPFFEYYRDHSFEYEPGELGYVGTTELRGRYRAREGLLFVAYGLSERLAVEFEAATISASLEKSTLDTSALPARLEQTGLGVQVRDGDGPWPVLGHNHCPRRGRQRRWHQASTRSSI